MAKKNIKGEILNTARRLFNEQGYNSVSMRDIADALHISVGNLTYHYRRKEELMEAVVAEMHRYYQPPTAPKTLQQLNAMFAMMQNNIIQNAFYFWHYTQLAQISPTVSEIQAQVVAQQYQALLDCFGHLRTAGLLQPEDYRGHYSHLAQAVQLMCIYWVPQSKLWRQIELETDFLNCMWGLLLPKLTDEGKAVYRDKIKKVRMEFE